MKSNYLKSNDFEKSEAVESIYNPDILKGSKTEHKYLRKEGGKYIYHESYQKTNGGKLNHNHMMSMYHGRNFDKFKSLANNALDDLKNGNINVNTDKYFELAKNHAKEHSKHNGERMKIVHSMNDEDQKIFTGLQEEHKKEGISPEQYATAYEEHLGKDEHNESIRKYLKEAKNIDESTRALRRSIGEEYTANVIPNMHNGLSLEIKHKKLGHTAFIGAINEKSDLYKKHEHLLNKE